MLRSYSYVIYFSLGQTSKQYLPNDFYMNSAEVFLFHINLHQTYYILKWLLYEKCNLDFGKLINDSLFSFDSPVLAPCS